MSRRRLRRLQASLEKRGGRFAIMPDAPPELEEAFLDELLKCPDCRAAVLEACNGEDREDVDIDDVLRGLAFRGDH